MTSTSALVLFSGGQDSAVCLAWALTRYERVETVGFDYGQRHRVELACRQVFLTKLRVEFPDWSARLGEDRVLNLGVLGEVSDTALTGEQEIGFAEGGLPNTFVPGRNLVFFTLAGAVAYRRGLTSLVGGMCETDYSGYPDCRRATLDAVQSSLTLGMDRDMPVETPLMYLDKAQTWALAREQGGRRLVDLIVEDTHTCYRGDRTHRHQWGYGCGSCPACELRANGWVKWQAGAP
ncbi:MAG: 7-cyano-7-deazaguanine synthase QueC [Hyphomonadaceae bacterium]